MQHTGDSLKIGLAQVDAVVGDIEGNARRVIAAAQNLEVRHGARLAVFPELCLLGYPPDDLLLRPDLPGRIDAAVDEIAVALEETGIAALVGLPLFENDVCYNGGVLLDAGKRVAAVRKRCLPNYGVFDEKRYFSAGDSAVTVSIDGHTLGLMICEDIWQAEPASDLAAAGAELILCPNASPYHCDKAAERLAVARRRVQETGCPLVYVNQVGGQDDLVFDGDSFAIDAYGNEALRLPAFVEGEGAVAWRAGSGLQPVEAVAPSPRSLPQAESIYRALTLGVRDYVTKNGFEGVFVGLSGGIDSALVLALAADALGPERVTAVRMPSRYTAQMSLDDAAEEAERLGVRCETLSIEPAYEAFLDILSGPFAGMAPDTTEENIQARSRGLLLMALANKHNAIVLATGNKSEMAVGYATLYGDMAGGFAPLKDVSKTRVYALARWRNEQALAIPERVLTREPSAELAADQADSDSLPPYDVLDPILEALVERDESVEDIAAAGFNADTVRRVARMLVKSEYKRRQAAPGPKVSPRAFGRERRYPITSRYSM
ncbi:NAD+ synthase [Halofilum ochraceum]|uniref:NAD+ synthase n=1 Tax=Halofilum ochraceum TaxID=1611323 RepID=UPI0008D97423|nr:NAD+ synthase [Halofilum ochraceum]